MRVIKITVDGPTGSGKARVVDLLRDLKAGKTIHNSTLTSVSDTLKKRDAVIVETVQGEPIVGTGEAVPLPTPATLSIYIEGPPGSGKTVIANMLSNIAVGYGIGPNPLKLLSGFLSRACIYDAGRTVQRFTPSPDKMTGGTFEPEYNEARALRQEFADMEAEAAVSLGIAPSPADPMNQAGKSEAPSPLLQLVFMDGSQPWDASIDTVDQSEISGGIIELLKVANVLTVGTFGINFVTTPRKLGAEFAQEVREAILGDYIVRLGFLLRGAGLLPVPHIAPWEK